MLVMPCQDCFFCVQEVRRCVMKLFDAHCHLPAFAKFTADKQDEVLVSDASRVMERAAVAGIERIAVCGTSPKDWSEVLQIPEKYPQVFPMIGIHPWFVKGRDGSPSRPSVDAARPAVEPYLWENDFQALEKTVRKVPMSGIGETGLDFQERFTNRAEQAASFAAHLDLARELNRPVAVHCVQAWGRLIEILRQHPAPRVLLHAFGGAPELIPELLELNCWFSFCGTVTNPEAKRVRASAAAVQENRLLIETDSPDFPPFGCKPPNEPANLIHIARAVAQLRGVSADQIAEITLHNAQALFV